MLGPVIGYDQAAEIVKQALQEGRTIIEVARERTNLSKEKLEQLLDPLGATRPPRSAP
jgi:fumarate hydratase class II